MKPFDLEAAKRGEPIVTRDGRKAKFIAHVPEAKHYQKIVLLMEGGLYSCNIDGHGVDEIFFMAPPPMRSINGYEYPEPVQEPVRKGKTYFLADPGVSHSYQRMSWDGSDLEVTWLRRGLIHLTPEAAALHARAIILAGGGEV